MHIVLGLARSLAYFVTSTQSQPVILFMLPCPRKAQDDRPPN